MAFTIPTGSESALAADFRNRAQQITSHAAAQNDNQLQRGFLDIASTYQRMAEHLERKFGVARAVQIPTQPAGAEMTAAVTPSVEPGPPSEADQTDPPAPGAKP